jgi:hypothetical protein
MATPVERMVPVTSTSVAAAIWYSRLGHVPAFRDAK